MKWGKMEYVAMVGWRLFWKENEEWVESDYDSEDEKIMDRIREEVGKYANLDVIYKILFHVENDGSIEVEKVV